MSRANVPTTSTLWHNDGERNDSAPDGSIVPPGGFARLHGLTIREHFACEMAKAILTGAVTRGCPGHEWTEMSMAMKCADALLAELAKPQVDRLSPLVEAGCLALNELEEELQQRKNGGLDEAFEHLEMVVTRLREALP